MIIYSFKDSFSRSYSNAEYLNIFVQCPHFQTNVFLKFGETIPLWWHFFIFGYHSSEERLSEGSDYQCWTPLTLPLIPLHSSSNHSLGSDARVWVWVKRQNTAEKVFCLCWGLTSQSTIFQSCRDGATASWVINQYFRGVKCLAIRKSGWVYMIYIIVSGDASSAYRINRGEVGAAGRGGAGLGWGFARGEWCMIYIWMIGKTIQLCVTFQSFEHKCSFHFTIVSQVKKAFKMHAICLTNIFGKLNDPTTKTDQLRFITGLSPDHHAPQRTTILMSFLFLAIIERCKAPVPHKRIRSFGPACPIPLGYVFLMLKVRCILRPNFGVQSRSN